MIEVEVSQQSLTCQLCLQNGETRTFDTLRALKFHLSTADKHKNVSLEEYTFKYIPEEVKICPFCEVKYICGISTQRKKRGQTCGKAECVHKLLSQKSSKIASNMSKESREIAAQNISKTRQRNKLLHKQNAIYPKMLINLLPYCKNCGKNCQDEHALHVHNKVHDTREMKCQEENCSIICVGIIALARHCRIEHGMNNIDFIVKYVYDGVRPTCKCGCGMYTSSVRGYKFRDYIVGHFAVMNNKIRNEKYKGQKVISESKISNKLYDILKKYFKDIRRSYLVGGFFVDFYIRDIDAFIEFDGDFWHGNFDVESIREKYPDSYKSIMKKMKKDKRQNEFFIKNNLSFYRISEEDFKKCNAATPDHEVISKIRHFSGSNRLLDLF